MKNYIKMAIYIIEITYRAIIGLRKRDRIRYERIGELVGVCKGVHGHK